MRRGTLWPSPHWPCLEPLLPLPPLFACLPSLPPQSNPNDNPDRIFVGGLPYYLTEDQCRELLGSFGAIKSFDLVKDRDTGNSKG